MSLVRARSPNHGPLRGLEDSGLHEQGPYVPSQPSGRARTVSDKGSRAPSGAHPGSGRGKHRRDLRSRRGIRSGSHPLLRQTLRTAAPAVRGTRDLKDSSLQE